MAEPAPTDQGLDAHAIRQRFLDFFVARGHAQVSSASLIPRDDPSLLFVNAGMVQFKDVFLGREQRPYQRAVTVQRCLRAGGKHNDLDNVGFTPRHHTLFEMLGNFSFGDYFKADAIAWAWEFLTGSVASGGLGLPPERLVVTVYDGQGEDAPADDQAYELWRQFVPEDRIYRCGAKDNFWMMGDTGPCGPCSEIHIYAGERAPGNAKQGGPVGPAHEDQLYVELWNLVFMQYEKRADGSLVKLPKPSVDTGAGLERLASAVLKAESNYDTDLLHPLVLEAQRLAGVVDPPDPAPFRVIADHARATAFLIADGVFPDRAGRSYVLRRIMRRAIRHGTEVGLDEPFFHRVCSKVVEMFGAVYPELRERAATIEEVVQTEEAAFRRTLGRGLRRLRNALQGLDPGPFPADVAADLYDTYGFPLDLTGVICREHGFTLDEEQAEAEVRKRQRAGEGRAELGQEQAVADVYFRIHEQAGDSEFVGHEQTSDTGRLVAIVADGHQVESAEQGSTVEMIFDRTPFYAESGGQVGDAGRGQSSAAAVVIEDVRRPRAGLHVHRARVARGRVGVGETFELEVDDVRRSDIRRNHSATHLLHHALREVLGAHVVQKGSLVAPDRLRFDFAHGRPVSADERRAVEQQVNRAIVANVESRTRVMGLDEAKSAGAIGLFGEKYGEQVRVVNIGPVSIELCGGTHVARTGDIGSFIVISETGIAQGVRRIEAVTGMAAVDYVQRLGRVAQEAMDRLHLGAVDELPARIDQVQADVRSKEQQIADLQRQLATGTSAGEEAIAEVAGIKLLTKRLPFADPKTLRQVADVLRDRLGSGVVVLGSESEGKATLLVAVTRDLNPGVHAGKIVGLLAAHVDGRGGGRPDLAQAGGPNAAGLDAALGAAASVLQEQVRPA